MSTRPPQDEEDDLADLKCLVLKSMREILVRDIDPSKFLPYLRSKFVIDGRESATIKSCCSKSVYDGAEKFIDVLCTKGSKGYDQFCVAIMRDETQLHILKHLNKRLEREKHIKKERDRLRQQQVADLERRRRQDPNLVQPFVPCPRPLDLGGEGAPSAHTTSCIGYVPQEYLRPRESPNQTSVMGSLGYQQPANSPLQTFPSGSPLHSPGFQSPNFSGYQQPAGGNTLLQPPGSLGFDSQFNIGPYQPRAPDVNVPWTVGQQIAAFSPSSGQADDGPRGQTQALP